MNKDLLRLEKIKAERKDLLSRLKEKLNSSNGNYNDSLSQISKLIDCDEKSIKKFQALTKTQTLLADIIMEVLEADKEEDILKLRNKLNYLISKIKKELKTRNISREEMALYEEKTKEMRKNISNYIRVLKRNEKISEIENLMARYDSLSLDEMKKLKKLLSSEVKYNTRNKSKYKNNSEFTEEDNIAAKEFLNSEECSFDDFFKIDKSSKKDSNETENPFYFAKEVKKEVPSLSVSFDSFPAKIKEPVKECNFIMSNEEVTYHKNAVKSNDRFLLDSANTFRVQYGLKNVHEYSSRFIINVFNLLRNIPAYVINRSKVKYMVSDTCRFYKGSDLLSYIAYTKKRNSILTGLKSVFSKSYLFNGEGKYLNVHNNCSKWLNDYCEKNNLSVNPNSLSLR